ncbi:MAG: hypothetical protein KGS28_05240 [Betaproteobacteria bacterium]|nr:hypothetical protein [Betaproteobacteria bacterium]
MADEKILWPLLLAAGVALLCGLMTMIVFGCTTVRRLRKHPELRASFGWQPLPGFATVQAAMALTLPRSFARVLVMSPLRSLLADPQALHRHTSPWEHRLARFAYLNLLAYLLIAIFFSEMQDWGAVTGAAIVAGCTSTCVLAFSALPSLLTFVEIRRMQRLKTRGPNKLDDWWAELMDSLK